MRRLGQRFVTRTSNSFSPGLAALVMSTRNGAFQRMPKSWPFSRTSAISFTLPRSSRSERFSPKRSAGMLIVLRYVAVPEKYRCPCPRIRPRDQFLERRLRRAAAFLGRSRPMSQTSRRAWEGGNRHGTAKGLCIIQYSEQLVGAWLCGRQPLLSALNRVARGRERFPHFIGGQSQCLAFGNGDRVRAPSRT